MGSRVARHTLETLATIAALGVVPGTVFPQSERAPPDEKERIAEDISVAVANDGPQSPDLIEPLTELGELYETEGAHALATAALEQARQLVRANYGLHSLEQLPLMQRALDNQQALGNLWMVQALEEEMFELARRHPDDLRTVAIHRDIGMRRLDILRRFVAGEAPPELYGAGEFFPVSFEMHTVVQELVSEAQIHFADAAAVVLRNGLYASDELHDLEMEIVRSSDLLRRRRDGNRAAADVALGATARAAGYRDDIPDTLRNYGVGEGETIDPLRIRTLQALQDRTNSLWDLAPFDPAESLKDRRHRVDDIRTRYQLGRESYLRLLVYDEAIAGGWPADGPAWRRRLDALVQLADWDLLYSANGMALDTYAQVHEVLGATGIAEQLHAAIFAPPLPIVLPTFLPNPLETEPAARYIDVSFEVTRFGQSRRIEILGAAPNVADAEKDELVNLVRGSRFRPRVTDGELGRASPVVVRYYLNE